MGSNRISRIGIVVLAMGAALPALADSQFRIRRMMRNDVPPGKGQCDIRLQVDNEVEVSVRGDMLFLHTIAGREPRDDGSECNAPLPGRDVAGFNFEVKDSRNEIRLLSEPSRRSNYAAVVYIRDSAGGEGRYHFRLSWAMGMAGGGGGGYIEPRREGFRDYDGITFRGEGRGSVFLSDRGEQRLFDCSVNIDRGRVAVEFRMEGGRTLQFAGMIVSREGGRIRADVEGYRVRGPMWLSVDDRRNVNSISLEAANQRDRLRLRWDRR